MDEIPEATPEQKLAVEEGKRERLAEVRTILNQLPGLKRELERAGALKEVEELCCIVYIEAQLSALRLAEQPYWDVKGDGDERGNSHRL